MDACIKDLSRQTEGEITRACCLHRGVDEHRVKKRSFAFAVGYAYCFRTYSLYLSFRHGVLILYRRATLPPRRSPLVLRLFALALADGSGLPFSLYPPPAALESQTPQRKARALPRRAHSHRSAIH